MKALTTGRGILYLFCVLFTTILNTNAQIKVLFYGFTHTATNEAAQFIADIPGEFAAIGSGSAVWTPGHTSASLDWSRKSTADFAAFDVIVIGDLATNQISTATNWTGAIANVNTWSAAITGNVLVFGADPEIHAGSNPTGGGTYNDPGARKLIQQAIRFASDDGQAGPGLYIALAAVHPDEPSPVDPNLKAAQHLLSGLGDFSLVQGEFDTVQKIYHHPLLATVTDDDLGGWGWSLHSGFISWPNGFFPIGLVTDSPLDLRTPPVLLPAGVKGLVHILAKSPSDALKEFYLTPPEHGRVTNTTHTVVATFLHQDGSAPSPGKTVNFSLESGSVNFPKTGSGTTGAGGSVSWSYAGGSTAGKDRILATVIDGAATNEARAEVTWAPQVVSISAPTLAAVEPATSGGAATSRSFTITRSTSSGTLDVTLQFSGTAFSGSDYTSPPALVQFLTGQTSKTVTITPLYDTAFEVPETVIATIDPDSFFSYAVSTNNEATITITSAQTLTISFSASTASITEGAITPLTITLQRSPAVGEFTVPISFSGTASFGADYEIENEQFGFDRTIFFQEDEPTATFDFVAVSDSRAETGGETAVITIPPSPEGNYSVGSPSQISITIQDNNSVQTPSLGWKIITITSGNTGGLSINTVPDGSGGWRGQVAGFKANSSNPAYLSFFWDNGNFYNRYAPPAFASYQSYWSEAYSLNDNGTLVGSAGYAYSHTGGWTYYQQPCLWTSGQIYPALLPQLAGASLENCAIDINYRDSSTGTGGVIIGNGITSGGKTHAVAWIPDFNGNYTGATDLSSLGGNTKQSYAAAINEWGDYVGESQHSSGNNYHAFRRMNVNGSTLPMDAFSDDMGTATYIDSHSSEGTDINNYGEMVGASQMPSGQYRAGFKIPETGKNEGWVDLGVLGTGSSAGNQSVALSINDNGLIVGTSTLKIGSSYYWRAFICSNEGNPASLPMSNLVEHSWVYLGGTNYQGAVTNGWTLTRAEKINNSNWIVAQGVKNGVTYAVVLSPRDVP